MGTPDFAVGVLDTLVKHQHTIVGVITAPDRPHMALLIYMLLYYHNIEEQHL